MHLVTSEHLCKIRVFATDIKFSLLTQSISLAIDHFHNYGPGTRFGASPARISCDVCVSHLSFRFSSALEYRSVFTVVFLAVPIEAGLVLHSSLMVCHGQVSSGSAGYLPFVRLTDRTSASPTTRSYAIEQVLPEKNFRFHARAKGPVDSSITSSFKLKKARDFPKAGAVPSVFSFSPHLSQVSVRST